MSEPTPVGITEGQRQLLLKAAASVRDRNILNILAKLQKGHTLTKAERDEVDDYIRGAEQDTTEPHPVYGFLPQWAKNKTEAAMFLGVPYRQKFLHWRRQFEDAPREHSTGVENLWAWEDFLRRHALREGFRTGGNDVYAARQRAEAKRSSLQAEELEEKLREARASVKAVEDIAMVNTIVARRVKETCRGVGAALAPRLAILQDIESMRKVIDDHMFGVLTELANLPYSMECPGCGADVTAHDE